MDTLVPKVTNVPLEEAQRLCEDWLVGQDRCYRN